jgi:hypothetical protein
MIKFLAAGLITLSLSAPEVNWKEITTDFSHWSYYSQKEVKELQKTEHCFVWRSVDAPVLVKTHKKDKK